MNKIYIGIGSNLGDKRENISRAVLGVEALVGELFCVSSLYETEPWGFDAEEYFLNMVIGVETVLEPKPLLSVLMGIEESLGRERDRSNQYRSRPIDLDILLYNNLVFSDNKLTIPHPRIAERRFVLLPLAEVCGNLFHPVSGKSIEELLEGCSDNCGVKKL